MRTINEDMLQKIESEIALSIAEGTNKRNVDLTKAKAAAKLLVNLAVSERISVESAKSDYISSIERICQKN